MKGANDKVEVAQQDLAVAQNNANVETRKDVTVVDLKTFRLDTVLTVNNNEVSIAELKLKMRKSGSALDELYAQRIDTLEMRNKDLKVRFKAYKKSQSDWENFKFEVKHDLDEIGKVFNEIHTCKNEITITLTNKKLRYIQSSIFNCIGSVHILGNRLFRI